MKKFKLDEISKQISNTFPDYQDDLIKWMKIDKICINRFSCYDVYVKITKPYGYFHIKKIFYPHEEFLKLSDFQQKIWRNNFNTPSQERYLYNILFMLK